MDKTKTCWISSILRSIDTTKGRPRWVAS